MSTATVTINVRAATKQAASEIDKLKKSISGVTTTAGWKNMVTGVGVGVGLSAYNALSSAVAGLGGTLADSVRAAAQEETGIARLGAALKANVEAFNGNTQAIERTIASRQRLAFSDDELRTSLATLVAATKDVDEAFALQATAMDLARLKGISLDEASTALVRVEAGQYRMLKSLGIVLREGATQTEALAAVQAVAAGQAESYGKTAQASFERLSIAIDNLKESVGGAASGPIAQLADALAAFIDNRQALVAAIGAIAAVIALVLLPKVIALAATVTVATAGLNVLIIAAAAGTAAMIGMGTGSVRSAKDVRNAGDAIKYTQQRAERLSSAAQLLKDDLYELGTAAGRMAGRFTAAADAYQALLSKRRQSSLLKDDVWEGAAAVAEKLKEQKDAAEAAGEAAKAQALETVELVKRARDGIASLRGLGTTLRDLTSTFSASWTPAVLTSSQAAGALQAALGKVKTAVGGLKVGVESTRAAVANAFEAMRQAAANYFEAVHRDRLRDLANANSAIQSQLSAQIGAINAGLQAQRDAINAARDARREAALREALANAQGSFSDPLQAQIAGIREQQRLEARADEESRLRASISAARTRRDRKAAQDALDAFFERVRLEDLEAQYQQNRAVEDAQQNLTDFLADEALQRADAAANARITELQAQQQHQQSLYDAQVEAENLRYQAQTTALQTMFAGLSTGLDAMKALWDEKNKEVVSLLKGYTGQLKSIAKGWMSAMQSAINANPLYIPAPSVGGAKIAGTRAAGGPVSSGQTYVVGERGPEYFVPSSNGTIIPNGGAGRGGDPVQINLVVDGKTLARIVDERLFLSYRTAARTGSAL